MSGDVRVSRRIRHLDGIRGYGMLMVIAAHWLAPNLAVVQGGNIGVDLFFVLSGFLITLLLWQETSTSVDAPRTIYGRFLQRRARRLLPALLAFVVVSTLIVALTGAAVSLERAVGLTVIVALQLGSLWRATGESTLDWMGHTWSLSVEWLFYLGWPAVVFLCRRRTWPPLRVALGFGLAAVALYAAALPTSADWFYFSPTTRAAQLLAGAALAMLVLSGWADERRWDTRLWAWVGIGALMGVFGWVVVAPGGASTAYRWWGFPLVTLAAALLCFLPMFAPRSALARVLELRWIVLIGQASYSIYLWHLFGYRVFDQNIVEAPGWVLALACVSITALTSGLSFWLFEARFVLAPPTSRPQWSSSR